MEHDNNDTFLTRATDVQPRLKLTWLSDEPVWVDQWPLKGERLERAHDLVQEQLQLGHIVPSTSPWNTPIFVIPKKSGKWRLLQDLWAINAVMAPMGALQPGTPNPTMIPDNWHLKVIDLKDCFFTIHLHPEDCVRFAFSVPVINNDRPMQRFHWVVLPQGMKNSPTICQIVVSEALSNIRKTYDAIMLYHYMDDILLAVETESSLSRVFDSLVAELQRYGLQIATEKVQSLPPWKYLSWKLLDSHVYPQSVRLATTVSTLNDLQKLLGTINWLRPLLGITTHELSPLVFVVEGES
ncbi:hypothetical protein GRJ2_002729700 [Grus japonensis]|uniref:ribonuclease H n=1 Tax=Grus japonensis TaxID=30415 RepID=A0ABC9XYY9_GRUJA